MSDVQLSKPQRRNRFAHLGNHATIVRNNTLARPHRLPPEPAATAPPGPPLRSAVSRTPPPRAPQDHPVTQPVIPGSAGSCLHPPNLPPPPQPIAVPMHGPDGPQCSPWLSRYARYQCTCLTFILRTFPFSSLLLPNLTVACTHRSFRCLYCLIAPFTFFRIRSLHSG
ncbi:hypothetical protein N431DRAFT_110209 [Stipitochalara longipes BDJ]|nr:hypothetical protein N431DRAFT_110209 [Stipitochalara longipes BDJ]